MVSQDAGAVEAPSMSSRRLGEIAFGSWMALGRRLRAAARDPDDPESVARQSKAEGGAEELQRALVANAEEPEAAQSGGGEAEDDRPAHQPRLRRKRLRLIQTPANSSTAGAAQSGQVAGSSGGS